jgi:hypothetical protein
MNNQRVLLDAAAGGALAFLLLSIFAVDRIVTSVRARYGVEEQVAENSTLLGGGRRSTLLDDPRIAGQIEALGAVERLEKLQVVKLTVKASFTGAMNVNDITVGWCWEPNIVIRFQEENPEQVRRLTPLLNTGGDATRDSLLREAKGGLDFTGDAALERRYEEEFRGLYGRKDYAAVLSTVLLLEGKQAYLIFNKRLAIPMKPARTRALRNLCFALSISNLIAVRRHGFEIDEGGVVDVKGKKCKQFTVKDKDGAKLDFFFDEETKLLSKISHMGHDPKALPSDERQILWEHYFSDYRETDGIKQWRRLEAHNSGRPFATLDVTEVRFFDEMQPEMRRPAPLDVPLKIR